MAYKVYLSPSNQPRNMCVLGHSEKEHCEEFAKKLAILLIQKGIETKFRNPDKNLTVAVNESVAWGADLYLPMHTNAHNGKVRGSRFGYASGRSDSKSACEVFQENFRKIYPDPSAVKLSIYTFSESTKPKCPSVYCETVFHDNIDDAKWLHANMDRIAQNFAESIVKVLGAGVEEPKPQLDGEKVSETIVRLKITREENATFFNKNIGDIIEIPLDKYLLGVVPAEIGNPHIEAARAQAIAARTYAYTKVVNGGTIDDTTTYQAYRAPRSTSPYYANAHQAVRDTAGQLLLYYDKVIATAVYSHSNGGRIVSAKERWGSDRPYLIAKDDPWTKATGELKNGHGVGMSQCGAKWAATHGIGHEEILGFYYPGTTISAKAIIPQEPKPEPDPEPELPPTPPPTPSPDVLYMAEVVTRQPKSLNIWRDARKGVSLAKITRGAYVEVLQEVSKTRAKVRYGAVIGYCDRQYLKEEGEQIDALYVATVKTRFPLSLNIWRDARKGVSLGKIPRGEKVEVVEETDNTWAKVRYKNVVGYSDRQYLVRG